MEVTAVTIAIAGLGLLIMGLLVTLQLVAVIRPRAAWTIANVYGGDPSATDETAYFAFNQGLAWADALLWGPAQLAGSVGMLLGYRWGFVVALIGSVPFVYTAVPLYVWDRDLGFRRNTAGYWVLWVVFPAYGAAEMAYCAVRLLT